MERSSEDIRKDIINQLKWDNRIDEKGIYVDVTDHKVVLSGFVYSHFQRSEAEMNCRTIPGVTAIENNLKIRRPEGVPSVEDKQIEWDIKSVLSLQSTFDRSNIEIAVNNGIVILSGSVDEFWKKSKAEEIVSDVPGVYEVINSLSVVPTGSPYDQSIAADILGAISRVGTIDLESINVEVDGGRVRIKGKVPDWQSYSATHNAAKYTTGVTDLTNELVISR